MKKTNLSRLSQYISCRSGNLALQQNALAQQPAAGASKGAPEAAKQAPQQGLREEVGKPLLAAEALVKAKRSRGGGKRSMRRKSRQSHRIRKLLHPPVACDGIVSRQ